MVRKLAICVLALAAGASPAAATTGVIAYTATRGGGHPHLWTLDLATGAAGQVTNGRYGEEAPAWSPDGGVLAYMDTRRVRVPGLPDPQIVPLIAVRDFAAHSSHTITDGRYFDEEPVWRSDQHRIAFMRTVLAGGTTTTYPEIWVMRPSGRGARPLTHNRVADVDPAWSPDQSKLAFVRFRGTSTEARDVWVMRPDGTHQRLVARNGSHPAWDPDNRFLAFGSLTGRHSGCCPITNLTILDTRTHRRRVLVKNGGRPSWSPDGKQIVFQRLTRGHIHLWLVNANGTGLRRLTNGPGSEYAPAWRPL